MMELTGKKNQIIFKKKELLQLNNINHRKIHYNYTLMFNTYFQEHKKILAYSNEFIYFPETR